MIIDAQGVLFPVATNARGRFLVDAAADDLEHGVTVGIVRPVPAGRTAPPDGVAAETFQFLAILLSDEVVRQLDSLGHTFRPRRSRRLFSESDLAADTTH